MVFGLASSIAFISFGTLCFATELHIQEGCIDITVGTGTGAATDLSCACVPQTPQCFYKNYVTGWFTTKITIFDPPCEEVFKFPTRYAQVFYTVDGCLRDASRNPIKCCSHRPFQFPYVCPDIGDGYGCIPSTEHVSLGNLASLDQPVPFSNELTSNGGIASTDFMAQDANSIFLSDTNRESVGLRSPVSKRSIMAEAYRSERKRRSLENETVES